MTRKEWAEIKAAAELLRLGEKASLADIKKAYRRLSKKNHPDMRKSAGQKGDKIPMHKLTEAYQVLLKYCAEYRFPFVPEDDAQLDGEDWWFDRFGQDHHWGKGSVPKEGSE